MGLSKWWRSWAPPRGDSAAAARLGRSLIRSRRRSKISLAQPRATINAQRDVILRLNIDIALWMGEFKVLDVRAGLHLQDRKREVCGEEEVMRMGFRT